MRQSKHSSIHLEQLARTLPQDGCTPAQRDQMHVLPARKISTPLLQRWLRRPAAVAGVIATLTGACSAANTTAPGNRVNPGSSGGGPVINPGAGGTTSTGVGGSAATGAGITIVNPPPGAGGTGGIVDACATQGAKATVMRQPVDIIVVIDNSGSMQDEIDAVERSINVNFASILATSGVDYRVILISRHEKAGRATSICVTTPLSGAPTCTPQPPEPVFSTNFFQYSLKVDSLNSLVLILGTYNGMTQDEFDLAPQGWSAWLRPLAKKVFLEVTDDNSVDMTSQAFDAGLLALSAENFGTATNRKYTFHSIIGIGEKTPVTAPWLPTEPIQTTTCTGNGDTVENPGPVYQELSILTGGLRFPLCQFNAFDTVFTTIANNVATHAEIACEFDVPPPPADRTLDLSKVAVSYDPGDGTPAKTFGQAMSPDLCVADAFYIDPASQRIVLCPAACAAVQQGLKPAIDVLFTCAPTYIPPPK